MTKIFYARVDEFWRKEEKYKYLEAQQHCGNVEWQELTPDAKQTWLTEGMHSDFGSFLPMGTKESKSAEQQSAHAIFKTYSNGVKTNRDVWTYSFNDFILAENIKRIIATYNDHQSRWSHREDKDQKVDDFVDYDEKKISWSENLKLDLQRGHKAEFKVEKIRASIYRPFTKQKLYFDRMLNERVYGMPAIFPTPEAGNENRIICLSGVGHDIFRCQMTNLVVELKFSNSANGGTQCFPFYTYNEDGTNRRENITDWALEQFRNHYHDQAITKWDIFHYVYGVLHHPVYRERYAANLKRELPRILFTPDFHAFASAGAHLAELHVNYESQPEYPLEKIENPKAKLDWRVEKMKLSKDKLQIVYNDFLTLDGIPTEAFAYRLGNRSALDWVIDQYRVSTDKRSQITNDPNRANDPEYIVRLIGQVITVSLETMKIVNALPTLGIEASLPVIKDD